jgi:hypothetical protein
MKTGHRILLLGTVGCVGVLGGWSHQQFSRKGAQPGTLELYEAVARSLPPELGARQWLKVSAELPFFDKALDVGGADGLLRDYPELLRAEHVEFGPVRQGDQEAEVEVFFVLSGGRVAPCTFRFRFENRGWRVLDVKLGRPEADPVGGIRI